MGYADRSYSYSSGGGGAGFGYALTPWVRRLLIANFAVYLLMAVGLLPFPWAVRVFGFSPARVLWHPWTPITYMFVHAGFWHVFFNMLGLFFFGPPLERLWGGDRFIRFYIACGLGGALLSLLLVPIVGTATVVGASGALYGLLLAFALVWPDAPIYLWAVFPVKAKYFVGFLALTSLFYTFTGRGGGVASWAHLGGLLAGYGYLKMGGRVDRVLDDLSRRWRHARRPAYLTRTPPRPGPSDTTRHPSRRSVGRDKLDEVDRILDKIRAQGIDSLSTEERAFLDEMSRRYRSTT